MLMSEVTTFCSPGQNWAACEAQKWNCSPELIEEVFGDLHGIPIADREAVVKRIADGMKELKARGYKRAAYCETCGSKYNG